MSEEQTTTATANGDTAGAAGGSESTTAVAGAERHDDAAKATESKAAETGLDGTDSLLAASPETEAKAEAEKTADGAEAKTDENSEKKGDEDKKAEEITPESYGDFEIPEGMPVNQPMLDDFKKLAAGKKWDKATAQELVSLKVKEVQDQTAAFLEQRKAWVNELKTDPEFGGQSFDTNIKTASMALRQFDNDGSALKALQATGLDNNPAIVKLLHRVGVSVADDKVHTAKSANGKQEKPLGEALFGDMFEKK